jgi:hypothetical protein
MTIPTMTIRPTVQAIQAIPPAPRPEFDAEPGTFRSGRVGIMLHNGVDEAITSESSEERSLLAAAQ